MSSAGVKILVYWVGIILEKMKKFSPQTREGKLIAGLTIRYFTAPGKTPFEQKRQLLNTVNLKKRHSRRSWPGVGEMKGSLMNASYQVDGREKKLRRRNGGAHDGSRRHLGKRFKGSDLSWDKNSHAIFLSDTGFSFHFYERRPAPPPPGPPSFRNPSISVPCPWNWKTRYVPPFCVFFPRLWGSFSFLTVCWFLTGNPRVLLFYGEILWFFRVYFFLLLLPTVWLINLKRSWVGWIVGAWKSMHLGNRKKLIFFLHVWKLQLDMQWTKCWKEKFEEKFWYWENQLF